MIHVTISSVPTTLQNFPPGTRTDLCLFDRFTIKRENLSKSTGQTKALKFSSMSFSGEISIVFGACIMATKFSVHMVSTEESTTNGKLT
jgi:hypothetical protein